MISDSAKKWRDLAEIALDLALKSSVEEMLSAAAARLGPLLGESSGRGVWIELDNKAYGKPAVHDESSPSVEIAVGGTPRGQLRVARFADPKTDQDRTELLEHASRFIGCLVGIIERHVSLKESEERHRKLIGNLAQEMWSRTEALAGETSYLEAILRSSDDMIITTDLESRVVEFNPASERVLGFSAEEVQGRLVTELWELPEERVRILRDVNATGGVRNYETRVRTKSGDLRDISLTLSLLKDEQGRIQGTVGISKDITTEKMMIRELERLNRNYRETINFIAHESKNALIVIGGFIRRVLEGEQDPSRKEKLEIAYHHSKFLEAMSWDFLVMAELEHGEFGVRKELIKDFYADVIEPAMVGIKERYPHSAYDTSMGGVGHIEIMGDRSLLQVVYRNLFGNALKYRHPHGRVSYGVVTQPDGYIFNVWNEGPGVPQDQVERIFDKFYRVDNDITRGKRGTGLGLYNIRRIIEAHGGWIWCETSPGLWVNFLFRLPKQ
jgi:PAS domain S-box-containing protein